jgi:hypothetical protein
MRKFSVQCQRQRFRNFEPTFHISYADSEKQIMIDFKLFGDIISTIQFIRNRIVGLW